MMNTGTSNHHQKGFWFVPNVAHHIQPTRYTRDDIILVKSERIGAPSEPYSTEFLLRIRGTEHYIAISYENEGARSGFDINNARLATPEGEVLRGKQGKLPAPIRKFLNEVWNDQSFKGTTPTKAFG